MQYYRCKCGKSESWGSMPPKKCTSCPICNTTLARDPEGHRKPSEHNFVTKYDENTGEPYEVCSRCHIRKDDESKDWQDE